MMVVAVVQKETKLGTQSGQQNSERSRGTRNDFVIFQELNRLAIRAIKQLAEKKTETEAERQRQRQKHRQRQRYLHRQRQIHIHRQRQRQRQRDK